jgi:hypothetical protein
MIAITPDLIVPAAPLIKEEGVNSADREEVLEPSAG